MADLENPFIFTGGDTAIEVTYKGEKVIGKVNKYAMAMASPVWNKFVFPPWKKKHDSRGAGVKKPIDFLGDNSDALRLLLNIVHFQFQWIPEKIEYDELFNVAVLCDQYDCVALLRPWFGRWFDQNGNTGKPKGLPQPWLSTSFDQIIEDGITMNTITRKHVGLPSERWLFIGWVSGNRELFEEAMGMLVLRSRKSQDGHLLGASRADLEEPLVPGITICTIATSRRLLIQKILDLLYAPIKKYLNNEPICDRNEKCDAYVYGYLHEALEDHGLWPEKTADEILSSVEGLCIVVRGISNEMEDLRTQSRVGYSQDCEECYELELFNQVESLSQDLKDVISDAQLAHLESQRKKLYF